MLLEPCLVLNTYTGQWSIEDRPRLPPRIPPQFNWSCELRNAARHYRKHGEDRQRKRRLTRRRLAMEAAV